MLVVQIAQVAAGIFTAKGYSVNKANHVKIVITPIIAGKIIR